MVQSISVLIFFVPYVIFQPPMTVLVRKLGPTYLLGSIIVAWGAIMVVSVFIGTALPSMILTSLGNGLFEELGRFYGDESPPWDYGSGFLPWLCLPVVLLVHAL